jgi:hypothetical protein
VRFIFASGLISLVNNFKMRCSFSAKAMKMRKAGHCTYLGETVPRLPITLSSTGEQESIRFERSTKLFARDVQYLRHFHVSNELCTYLGGTCQQLPIHLSSTIFPINAQESDRFERSTKLCDTIYILYWCGLKASENFLSSTTYRLH